MFKKNNFDQVVVQSFEQNKDSANRSILKSVYKNILSHSYKCPTLTHKGILYSARFDYTNESPHNKNSLLSMFLFYVFV